MATIAASTLIFASPGASAFNTPRTDLVSHASSPAGVRAVGDPSAEYWHALAVKRLHLASYFERKRNEWRTMAKRLRAGSRAGQAGASSPASNWTSGYATWYGPGFYGSSPSCGGPGLTESSWWVATVPARCGAMVTICESRCVRAPARDTGGFPSSNLDMTPAVARALGGLYTHRVRWRFG